MGELGRLPVLWLQIGLGDEVGEMGLGVYAWCTFCLRDAFYGEGARCVGTLAAYSSLGLGGLPLPFSLSRLFQFVPAFLITA